MGIITGVLPFIAATNAIVDNCIAYSVYIVTQMGVYDPEVMCGEACEVKLEQYVFSIYGGITVFLSSDNFWSGRRDRAT